MKQKFRKGDTVVTLYMDNMPSKVEIIDVIKKDDYIYLAKDNNGIIQGFFEHEIGLVSRGYEWRMVQDLLNNIANEVLINAVAPEFTLKLEDVMSILRYNTYEDEEIF